MPKAKISALGCYVPPGVLTNKDLEQMVETNSEWIVERTGICERHIAASRNGHFRYGSRGRARGARPPAALRATNWMPFWFAP